ncbi:MAG TPA: DUF3685 domain-containing protein [Xenococcaceae cyanobacterium]
MTTKQIELFLVDRDPIFRLGFSVALEAFPDLVITAQEATAIATLGQLAQGIIPDILVIEFNLSDLDDSSFTAQEFCQRLRQNYPSLAVFILTSELGERELIFYKNLGIKGYIAKGSSVEAIVYALRQVAQGATYWQLQAESRPGWFKNTLARITNTGKQQIDADIAAIKNQLSSNDLSLIEQILLAGRKRELNVARWLANQISQEENDLIVEGESATKALPNSQQKQFDRVKSDSAVTKRDSNYLPPKFMLAVLEDDRIIAKIFNEVIAKISLGAINKTDFFLEIDVLRPQKKQELLYLILNYLGKTIESISFKSDLDYYFYLKEIWQQSTSDFFYNNYQKDIFIEEEQFTTILLAEFANIQNNLFLRLHWIEDLFNYLAQKQPITIDNVVYRHESPEAVNRVVTLVENLLITLANGVMQVILNNFADLEIFKYQLYHPSYRSSREIARFRNEISWRYRQDNYWEHPRNIFESRYRFFGLRNGKIVTLYIYAHRTEELYQLQGLPWLITIILEIRDAIAPRLQSVFSLVGSGLVFVLTQVIGRGLGLIAKGILQGIGSTFKDVRNSNKGK